MKRVKVCSFIFFLLSLFIFSFFQKDSVYFGDLKIEHVEKNDYAYVKEVLFGKDSLIYVYLENGTDSIVAVQSSNCKLDSVGMVKELNQKYAFISCFQDEKENVYLRLLNDGEIFLLPFENINRYVFDCNLIYVGGVSLLFLVVLFAVNRFNSSKTIWFVSILLSIYCLLEIFFIKIFDVKHDSIFYLVSQIPLFPRCLGYALNLHKYPTLNTIFGLFTTQLFYIGLSFFFMTVKKRGLHKP